MCLYQNINAGIDSVDNFKVIKVNYNFDAIEHVKRDYNAIYALNCIEIIIEACVKLFEFFVTSG